MSYDISICHHCGGLICFPYGQKMHIGTGWDCWKELQEESEGDEVIEFLGNFVFDTPLPLLRQLVTEAKTLYGAWRKKPDRYPIVAFLAGCLKRGQNDVVHEFFRAVGRARDRRLGKLVRELMRTPEWQRFARTQPDRPRHPKAPAHRLA